MPRNETIELRSVRDCHLLVTFDARTRKHLSSDGPQSPLWSWSAWLAKQAQEGCKEAVITKIPLVWESRIFSAPGSCAPSKKNGLNGKINNVHRWSRWCLHYLREQIIRKHLGFILSPTKGERRGDYRSLLSIHWNWLPERQLFLGSISLHWSFFIAPLMSIKKVSLYCNFQYRFKK